MVKLPLTEACAARLLICPVAPDSLVHVPLTVLPVCLNVAVTVSTMVAPDVTNCHDPVHVPARLSAGVGDGDVETPPHVVKSISATAIATPRLIGHRSL